MRKGADQRAILMKEFNTIIEDLEKKIVAGHTFTSSQEFEAKKRRLIVIMSQVEGCSCQGRGAAINSMFDALKNGNINVARHFAPMVFKSFYIDFKKIIKVL